MTGSLTTRKTKNGEFYYATLNLKDETGKRIKKWIHLGLEVKGNKRKAECMLRDLIKEYEDKKVDIRKDIDFAIYMENWLDTIKYQVETNTLESYNYQIKKHIVPYFTKHKVNL